MNIIYSDFWYLALKKGVLVPASIKARYTAKGDLVTFRKTINDRICEVSVTKSPIFRSKEEALESIKDDLLAQKAQLERKLSEINSKLNDKL